MQLTLEIPDESVAQLQRQALSHGVTLEAWLQNLASEKAREDGARANNARVAIATIHEIQKRVRPDPEGWTIRDYINHVRR